MSSEYQGSIEYNLYDDEGNFAATCILMPESEIAKLGKERLDGVVWVCGDYVEIITTSTTFLSGVAPEPGLTVKKELTSEEIERRVAFRAAKNVRRLVNTNRLRYMWTLTTCPKKSRFRHLYSNPVPLDAQKDYGQTRLLWKSFIRKVKRGTPKIVWLVVFELHSSAKTSDDKRGSFHTHFVTDSFIDWQKVFDMWGHGNVRFDDFEKRKDERGGAVQNPGAYVSKYISKSFPEKARHRKRYSCSRNIRRPLKLSTSEFYMEGVPAHVEVFRNEKTFDFFDEKIGIGGVYGIIQKTLKISNKENTP